MVQAQADRVIDGREMEPPDPFVQTMDALDSLPTGQKLLLVLAREPFPLYRALALNGISWQTECTADGVFEVLMWHTEGDDAGTPVL